MERELELALAQLAKAAAGACERFARPPVVVNDEPKTYYLSVKDLLVFPGSSSISVERLVRIIWNSKEAAERVAEYVRVSEIDEDAVDHYELSHPPRRNTTLSYSARLRDSLSALCDLLGVETNFVQRTPNWLEAAQELGQENVGNTAGDPWKESEQSQLALAEVYKRLKPIRDNKDAYVVNESAQRELNEVMTFISEGG
jgi:hypothetical protein